MFSQTVEYALRIAVYLGGLNGSAATTRQIASATKAPPGYLSKVLQQLSRAGLVRSQRGLHGGSVLALPPNKLSIHQVVQAVQPIQRIRSCPLGLQSHATMLCPLHRRLDETIGMVEKVLKETTIAELLANYPSASPLCQRQTSRNHRARQARLTK